jgi:hypothetical protein
MAGDLDHALPEPIWVHRLFAYRPGQRFPSKRLHFAPVPVEIPRGAYMRTTFRIQHLAGLSAERRRARYEKYLEADPEAGFAYSYEQLLEEPRMERAIRWQQRSPSSPALFTGSDVELMPEEFADFEFGDQSIPRL